jgi:Tol biopolymer transport system component
MDGRSIDRLNAALVGRYRVERELGEGGMATVYLADDLRHERKVALKVLKPELAAVVGAERFLTEIKTTANLQHPHILPLFDSGEADGFLFYVMPYIEGETLRERIDRDKQLPVDEAVRIAKAVANALHTAHEAGIVHRDIKPGNILMSRGEPLVADFGIALAVGTAGGSRLTETGLSVGTPYYMSPEQATGDQIIGPASDTYALACVLYEMLVGDPPYQGSTAQAVLGKIIQGSPTPPTGIRPSIPANVDAAIRKALEKLPADRFTDAHDFGKALSDGSFRHGLGSGTVSVAGGGRWSRLGPVAAGAAAVFAVFAVWGWTRSEPSPPVARYTLAFPAEARVADLPVAPTFSVSTGASALAWAAQTDEGRHLYVKSRADLDPVRLPDTEGARAPMLSPDGQRVAFEQEGRLRLIPVRGGAAITLADSVGQWGFGWVGEDEILFARVSAGAFPRIGRVSVSGGAPEIAVELEGRGAFAPSALPDGRGLLMSTCGMATCSDVELWVHDLDNTESRVLVPGAARGWYAASGHVVFVRPDGAVFALPFDPKRLEATGPAFPILEGVKVDGAFQPDMTVTPDGTVLLMLGSSVAGEARLEVASVSRSGEARPVDPGWRVSSARNRGWALSPDGTRLALALNSDEGDDIWIKDLRDGSLLRLTYDPAEDARPSWSPDGERVFFLSRRRGGISELYVRRADGADEARAVLTRADDGTESLWETSWSADGSWLVARKGGTSGRQGSRNIIAFDLRGDSAEIPLLDSEYDAVSPQLSPDGRWLAYASEESGTWEIYVRPFPDVTSGRTVVSRGGGLNPMWAHAGNEIFYIAPDGEEMMAATVETTGGAFRVTERTRLFSLPVGTYWSSAHTSYDVTPDDRTFILMRTAGIQDEGGPTIVLIENFRQEIEARGGR